ncbi:MAG: 5-formyltetrahydrofolate cyclo-ligase [Succinivibrionaceae bacterium]|nr:5-formyltetrahydrofolate cyclo-ligase [Succinivibrionaceae bacterium]
MQRDERRRFQQEVRELMRMRRAALTKEEVEAASGEVRHRLLAHPFLAEERLVASYCGRGGEIGTMALNAALLGQGHTVALPRVNPQVRGEMHFYVAEDLGALAPGAFSIPEPPALPENLVEPGLIEAILVPLVAFDPQGNRLGMGGGYYDRLLKRLSGNCLIIGLAHDFQMVSALHPERWDMPLDEIVTPTRRVVLSRKC